MSKPTFREGVSGLYFVRNPQTGAIERHDGAAAASLMDVHGWQPVSAEEAAPVIDSQAIERNTNPVVAGALGVQRGLLGGVPEMLLDPQSEAAEGQRFLDQGAPIATTLGEIGGTALPFLPMAKGVRLATAPGLLDAAGGAVTQALRGSAPGLGRTALSRVAGIGVEGAGQVTLDLVRRARLNDEPVNAGRLLDAYGLGAMLPALVVGAPLGAAEGLVQTFARRALARGGVVKQNVWKPGVSERDMMDIAMREHGVAAPGLLNEFHAANAKSPLLNDPAFHAVLNDPGPAGQQLRREVFQEAPMMREAAERELAERLNEGLSIDEMAATNWSGKLKAERVRNWINDGELSKTDAFSQVQGLRASGQLDDLAQEAARQVARKTSLGEELATKLGVDAKTAEEVITRGLATGDDEVVAAVLPLVKPSNDLVPAWREQALQAIDEYGEILTLMKERGKGHLGEQAGKVDRMMELVSGVRNSIADAPRSQAYIELDWMKKRMADWAKPDQYLGAGDDVARTARNAHETFRTMLEDAGLWGERAATAQRDMNLLFHKRMSRKGEFYDHWFEDAGRPDPKNPWANLKRATPERVRSSIGDVVDVNHERIGMYKEHIRETKELIGSMQKHFDLTPQEVARLGESIKSVDAAEDALNRAVYFNLRENQGKQLLHSGGIGSGWGARMAAGYVVGGPAGAMLGAYAMGKLNPGAGLYARSVIERLLRQNEGRVATAIKKLLTGKELKAPAMGVAQTLSRLSRMADSPDGVKQDEYQESIKEMLAAAQDPQKIEIALAQELGDVPDLMPNLIPNAVERVKKGLAYAISKAPAKPTATIFGTETSPIGDIEMDVWERIAEASLDPSSILDMAADGELIPEAVDAAEHVAPELVQDLRMEIAEQIESDDEPMSYDRMLQVAILFKMPVDQTTTPSYIRAQQLAYAAMAQPAPTNPRTFGETGVQETSNMSEADRITSGVPPS